MTVHFSLYDILYLLLVNQVSVLFSYACYFFDLYELPDIWNFQPVLMSNVTLKFCIIIDFLVIHIYFVLFSFIISANFYFFPIIQSCLISSTYVFRKKWRFHRIRQQRVVSNYFHFLVVSHKGFSMDKLIVCRSTSI